MQPRGSARARRMWCGGPAASARHWDGVPGLTDGTNQLRTSTEHVSRVDDDAPLTHDPLRHFQRCGGRLERANAPPIGSPGWVVWQGTQQAAAKSSQAHSVTRATRNLESEPKSHISSASTTPGQTRLRPGCVSAHNPASSRGVEQAGDCLGGPSPRRGGLPGHAAAGLPLTLASAPARSRGLAAILAGSSRARLGASFAAWPPTL